jgi:hypothetical protein
MADGTPAVFPGFKRDTLDDEIVHPDLYASWEIHDVYSKLRQDDPLHWTEPDGFRPSGRSPNMPTFSKSRRTTRSSSITTEPI